MIIASIVSGDVSFSPFPTEHRKVPKFVSFRLFLFWFELITLKEVGARLSVEEEISLLFVSFCVTELLRTSFGRPHTGVETIWTQIPRQPCFLAGMKCLLAVLPVAFSISLISRLLLDMILILCSQEKMLTLCMSLVFITFRLAIAETDWMPALSNFRALCKSWVRMDSHLLTMWTSHKAARRCVWCRTAFCWQSLDWCDFPHVTLWFCLFWQRTWR